MFGYFVTLGYSKRCWTFWVWRFYFRKTKMDLFHSTYFQEKGVGDECEFLRLLFTYYYSLITFSFQTSSSKYPAMSADRSPAVHSARADKAS